MFLRPIRLTLCTLASAFLLSGSVTGPDGGGNNSSDVTSDSGQITVPTELWRRRVESDGSHANLKGDIFTWEVKRATLGTVNFAGKDGEPFRVTLADQLPGGGHRIEVIPPKEGEGEITGYEFIYPAWGGRASDERFDELRQRLLRPGPFLAATSSENKLDQHSSTEETSSADC